MCMIFLSLHFKYFPFLFLRALSLASQEVRFHIDSETHDPIDVKSKELL